LLLSDHKYFSPKWKVESRRFVAKTPQYMFNTPNLILYFKNIFRRILPGTHIRWGSAYRPPESEGRERRLEEEIDRKEMVGKD